MNDYQIGETVYLKVPERGYRCVEIIDIDSHGRYVVRTTSGYEFTIRLCDNSHK